MLFHFMLNTCCGKSKTTYFFVENGQPPKLFSKMEDNLNFKENGRRSQFEGNWNTTQFFLKIQRQPHCFEKSKTTSICWQTEDNLYFVNSIVDYVKLA